MEFMILLGLCCWTSVKHPCDFGVCYLEWLHISKSLSRELYSCWQYSLIHCGFECILYSSCKRLSRVSAYFLCSSSPSQEYWNLWCFASDQSGNFKGNNSFFFSVTYIRFLSPSICLSSNMFVDVSSSQIPDRVNKNKMLHWIGSH